MLQTIIYKLWSEFQSVKSSIPINSYLSIYFLPFQFLKDSFCHQRFLFEKNHIFSKIIYTKQHSGLINPFNYRSTRSSNSNYSEIYTSLYTLYVPFPTRVKRVAPFHSDRSRQSFLPLCGYANEPISYPPLP